MIICAAIFLITYQLILASLVGYLLMLAAASRMAARSTLQMPTDLSQHILVFVPAHNEERLLPDLLASLARQDYPAHMFEVHVVADNCTDQTAAIARRSHVHVHVRTDSEHPGKGHALNWLLEQVQKSGEPFDAVVYLDADSIVSPNFLRVIAAHLLRGECAIQAYYAARNPNQSWAGSLRFAALAVLHFVRPLGRMALGGSAGLKGNGMCFTADILRQHCWSASVTEDIELHMTLLLDGIRVTFAPEATVWGEMPDNLPSSTSQHMRWEQGKKEMARIYCPQLLSAAGRELSAGHFRRAFLFLDALMEYVQPPFSVLAAASLGGLVASLALLGYVIAVSHETIAAGMEPLAVANILLALGILIGQAAYLLIGLQSVSAPRQVYLNLLYTPRLMLWKIRQMVIVTMSHGQGSWIRTKRNGD